MTPEEAQAVAALQARETELFERVQALEALRTDLIASLAYAIGMLEGSDTHAPEFLRASLERGLTREQMPRSVTQEATA